MDLEISKEEMLRIRGNVRHRLVISLHEHQLQARLLRKAGKRHEAAEHDHEVELIAAMIHAIDDPTAPDEPEPKVDKPTHLQEG
jgi:hypothetical protein